MGRPSATPPGGFHPPGVPKQRSRRARLVRLAAILVVLVAELVFVVRVYHLGDPVEDRRVAIARVDALLSGVGPDGPSSARLEDEVRGLLAVEAPGAEAIADLARGGDLADPSVRAALRESVAAAGLETESQGRAVDRAGAPAAAGPVRGGLCRLVHLVPAAGPPPPRRPGGADGQRGGRARRATAPGSGAQQRRRGGRPRRRLDHDVHQPGGAPGPRSRARRRAILTVRRPGRRAGPVGARPGAGPPRTAGSRA